MTCPQCGATGCKCAFDGAICKVCAAKNAGQSSVSVPLDLRMELKEEGFGVRGAGFEEWPSTQHPATPNPACKIVHFGYNNQHETGLIRRYAAGFGYEYWWEGIANSVFKAADTIKHAAMCVIWNGQQQGGPLVARLCRRRGIPVAFVEWGMLPQGETFFVDPLGFCGDSILARDVSWVNDADMERLAQTRAALQAKYPREDAGHVLAPLQIHNDSQVLYYSPYRNMDEFVREVEGMYPGQTIIARPHPKSRVRRSFERAKVESEGDFLQAAARASLVVGITSTCLYEAAILGVPVVALGDHPLRIQPRHLHERVLAGALALRVNREHGDLNAVLNRFGIRPL